MKRIIPILLIFIIATGCVSKNETADLLKDPSKWSGSEELIPGDDGLTIEGEYKTFIFQPGIFSNYKNFELRAEIMTQPDTRASIGFHTGRKSNSKGYEVHIDNSASGDWDRLLKTGSLSSIRNIHYKMVNNGEWFSLRIKVIENHIQIFVNDLPVVDYIEPEFPFRTHETEGKRLGSGTFSISSLFGHTSLKIKSLTVENLPSGTIKSVEDPEYVRKITMLNIRHLPLADYHVHEKGDLTMDMLLDRSAKLGINYGIAANCGLKFPIQNDQELAAYLKSIEGLPIFKAMQAEGREWVDMFSTELVSDFDYAFTDAMTWTNNNGTRMRLWIPEETEVGDPEDFMDQLVAQIERVVTEPIAIYVNPTYLPEEIADQYEALWTDERIDKVITALKDNNVALEINSRLQLPGDRVIEKAKAAGVKFALGTNNTDAQNLGALEWALAKVEQHNLQAADMFLPAGQ